MLKFLLGFIASSILISLVAVVGVLTWLGLTPLSKYFGSGQIDLGIKVTAAQTQAAINKVGTEIISLPSNTAPEQGFKLEGTRPATFTMDSQEISAHSNNRPWKNYPLKNVQIKIHEDGTIESSAVLIITKAMPYAMGLGYTEAQIKAAMQKYQLPPFEVPIYILGKGSVVDDQTSVKAAQLKIGGIQVPSDIVTQLNDAAEVVLDDLIKKNSQSFQCESLAFAKGKMDFKGSVAQKQYVVAN